MLEVEKKDESDGIITPQELEDLVKGIRGSKAFRHAPQRIALFNYLWAAREKGPSPLVDVWNGALKKYSRSAESKSKKFFDRDRLYEKSVRACTHDLRGVLSDHFRDVREGWHVELDNAVPTEGYRLEIVYKNDPSSGTGAFWEPHFDSRFDPYIVHIEQLFYNDWSERLVFRYYDCNAEHSAGALELLKAHHQQMHDAHEGRLYPTFPYFSRGEIEARELIQNWFDKYASIKVKPMIPRREPPETPLWGGSLILLGTAAGNSMMNAALEKYPDLPIKMEESAIEDRWYGQVVVSDLREDEKARIALTSGLVMALEGSSCCLRFSPEKKTILAILTRVRNPYNQAPVTILNASFGRGVEQLAALLTNDRRMQSGEELPRELPEYFQALFAIPLHSLDTQRIWASMSLLALRKLTISKIGAPFLSLD